MARAALEARFVDQAGGDRVEAERLRSEFYSRLGPLSGRARRLLSAERSELELIEWRALGVEVMTIEKLAGLALGQASRPKPFADPR